jgi:hypothetical protein
MSWGEYIIALKIEMDIIFLVALNYNLKNKNKIYFVIRSRATLDIGTSGGNMRVSRHCITFRYVI